MRPHCSFHIPPPIRPHYSFHFLLSIRPHYSFHFPPPIHQLFFHIRQFSPSICWRVIIYQQFPSPLDSSAAPSYGSGQGVLWYRPLHESLVVYNSNHAPATHNSDVDLLYNISTFCRLSELHVPDSVPVDSEDAFPLNNHYPSPPLLPSSGVAASWSHV